MLTGSFLQVPAFQGMQGFPYEIPSEIPWYSFPTPVLIVNRLVHITALTPLIPLQIWKYLVAIYGRAVKLFKVWSNFSLGDPDKDGVGLLCCSLSLIAQSFYLFILWQQKVLKTHLLKSLLPSLGLSCKHSRMNWGPLHFSQCVQRSKSYSFCLSLSLFFALLSPFSEFRLNVNAYPIRKFTQQ